MRVIYVEEEFPQEYSLAASDTARDIIKYFSRRTSTKNLN